MIGIILCLLWSVGAQASTALVSKSLQMQPTHLALATPENFGKTHFIVGQEGIAQQDVLPVSDEESDTQIRRVESNHEKPVRAYFSPDNDVKKKLIKLIDAEEKSIRIAIFMLTEPEISRALARAQKRGVKVEMVTDVGCLKDRANKVNTLCENGWAVYVYNPSEPNKGSSLMHHKFALFASSQTVWTGSYNFTKAASKTNQENAVIISDKKTFEKFVQQFERLKKRSYRYGKPARA